MRSAEAKEARARSAGIRVVNAKRMVGVVADSRRRRDDYGDGKGEVGDGRGSRANERLLCVTNATRVRAVRRVRQRASEGAR